MLRKKFGYLCSLVLAASAAGTSFVQAQSAFYLGAGGLGSHLEPRVNDSGFSVTETTSAGGKVFAGVDVSRRFSLEGYYSHLGNAVLSNQLVEGEIEYLAGGVSGLFYLYGSRDLASRQGLLLYGRAGIGFLNNSSTNGIDFNRLNDEHFAAGLGVEYGFNNGFGLRLEVLNHDVDAQDVSFSLIKRFGGGSDETPKVVTPVTAVPPVEPAPQPEPESQETMAIAPPPPPPPPLDGDGDGINDDSDLCAGTAVGAVVSDNGCVASLALRGVNFDSGSASLSRQAKAALDVVASELSQNPQLNIVVQSHTDNRGRAASNMELSRQRAVTVVRYLSDIGGIDLARLSAVGFGESEPLQSNNTAEGRRANRRVEIGIQQ